MACSCSQKPLDDQFRWTSADGAETRLYDLEIEAKARKRLRGGDYERVKRS